MYVEDIETKDIDYIVGRLKQLKNVDELAELQDTIDKIPNTLGIFFSDALSDLEVELDQNFNYFEKTELEIELLEYYKALELRTILSGYREKYDHVLYDKYTQFESRLVYNGEAFETLCECIADKITENLKEEGIA